MALRHFDERRQKAIELLVARTTETYDEIAKEVGVSRQTLHNWRDELAFHEEVMRQIKRSYSHRLAQVVSAVEREAIEGNAQSQRLFLQYAGELTERTEIRQETKKHVDTKELREKLKRELGKDNEE